MPTTKQIPASTTDDRIPVSVTSDVCAEIVRLAESARSDDAFFRVAFRAVADHFAALFAVMTLHRPTTTLDESYSRDKMSEDVFHDIGEAALLECQSTQSAGGRLYYVKQANRRVTVLSAPVGRPADDNFGAIAIVTECESQEVASALLVELQALASLIAVGALRADGRRTAGREPDGAQARAVSKVAQFSSVHELAFHLTNNLKTKLGCEQVAMAKVRRQKVELLAISGLDRFHPRSPGTLRIRQAMEECLDADQTVVHQPSKHWDEDGLVQRFPLHQRWHLETGSAVASIPLRDGDDCVAVVSLRRDADTPFTNEELTKTAVLLAPYGPTFRLLQRASDGLAHHAIRELRRVANRLLEPGSWGRRLATAVGVIALLWFCFGSMTYTVSVPSAVTVDRMRTFAAPYEGRIAESFVRPGDAVKTGQKLFRMDTDDLRLETQRLKADIAAARLEVAADYRESNSAAAAQAQARLNALNARLEINRHRIERATAVSPVDGHVAEGDLSKRIGEVVKMGTPLLEIAPDGDRSIELRLPEHVVVDLTPGMTGDFSSTARPEDSLQFKITSVHLAPRLEDGKKSFRAEANLETGRAWMLVGMEGTARVDVGRRRVWWVALHRVINFVRFHTGV